MTSAGVPGHIEGFLSSLGNWLRHYDCSLSIEQDLLKSSHPLRTYEVQGTPWPPSIMIHQTERSLQLPEPEFRVRAATVLPSEISDLVVDKQFFNRYATVAALLKREAGAEVACQSLLTEGSEEVVGAVVATACAWGARSLLGAVQKELSGERQEVTQLSAWGDIDFERIHYDHAHLGVARLDKHLLRVALMPGELQLFATQNPFFGGGLLSLFTVSKQVLGIEKMPFSIGDLNTNSFLFDDVPFFGAWCDRDEALTYVTFIPNALKEVDQIAQYLIRWARMRASSVGALVQLSTGIAESIEPRT